MLQHISETLRPRVSILTGNILYLHLLQFPVLSLVAQPQNYSPADHQETYHRIGTPTRHVLWPGRGGIHVAAVDGRTVGDHVANGDAG
jgi:hypothetical protein